MPLQPGNISEDTHGSFLNTCSVGAAYVFNGARANLFALGESKVSGLYLYKYLLDDKRGVLVFAPPVPVGMPLKGNRAIFQDRDGIIHGFWLAKGQCRSGISPTFATGGCGGPSARTNTRPGSKGLHYGGYAGSGSRVLAEVILGGDCGGSSRSSWARRSFWVLFGVV